MSLTRLPNGLYATPLVGANPQDYFQGTSFANPTIQPLGGPGGNIFFVDGDNGSDGNDGLSPDTPKKTIGGALSISAHGATIYVKANNIAAGGTDPVNYAETITIGAKQAGTKIIGCGNGIDQAAQPQIKKGSGAVALLTIKAPGCLIKGITFNGNGSTGGGILLSDDGSTVTAEGTTIDSCVFKNCVGSAATDSSHGGAVQIGSTGGAWDTTIRNCLFYNNMGGFVLLGTSNAVPQDITLDNNVFSCSVATNVDTYIWGHAGSGIADIIIKNNVFGFFPSGNTNNNFMDLTLCTGTLSGNTFSSNGKTFGAAANVLVPTTVFMAANYQEKSTSGSGEIFRT
jgi:hypothetical protein